MENYKWIDAYIGVYVYPVQYEIYLCIIYFGLSEILEHVVIKYEVQGKI